MKLSVLVADDNPDAADSLALLLRARGRTSRCSKEAGFDHFVVRPLDPLFISSLLR